MGGAENNLSREFWTKRLAAKNNELALVEAELEEETDLVGEEKLTKKAKRILKEIEAINNELSKLDKNNSNSNVSHLSLDKSFQKIDFSKAKKIAQSINEKLGDESGAILIFLQRSTKQKGNYCIKEFLDVIVSDRRIGEEIIGDYRPYSIDLGSSISEFNEVEFSKRLASYVMDQNTEESLDYQNSQKSLEYIIKELCLSLKGGSTIFIEVKNLDSLLEQEAFLNWFMENFWGKIITELDPVFKNYSKIRFIVALIAKSKVFPDCCSIDYFCTKDTFDHRKIIEVPLPDWTVQDIKSWLITNLGLSNYKSSQRAKEIYRESEGTPDTICSILEKIYEEENSKYVNK